MKQFSQFFEIVVVKKIFKIIIAVFCFNAVFAEEAHDPLENFNRAIFDFNQAADEYVLAPVARGYRDNVPDFAQARVGDFFANLGDVSTLANQFLQGKISAGVQSFGRITLNTTFGLFGFFDVASDLGVARGDEDFGQTLAVWGVDDGAYLVLPFFGPSTVRDGVGLAVDMTTEIDAADYIDDSDERLGVRALEIVDGRAEILPLTDLIYQADDPYIAARSSYLQKREYDIFDGDPPADDDFEDF